MGNNAEYWTKRFEELEKAQLLNEAKYITELKETYDKACLLYTSPSPRDCS